MNRYDHHFRSLPATVRASAIHKAGYARGAIFEHRANGFSPVDDDEVVRQFDLAGMPEFWDIELSEPMECMAFAHALAVHFMVIEHKPDGTARDQKASGPKAMRAVDIVKAGIRAALRQARADGELWFLDIPDPPPSSKLDSKAWLGFMPSDVVFVEPDPPLDGIYLSKLKVRPRAAAEWLLAMPKRRHLVPPSLIAVVTKSDDCLPSKAAPQEVGRPIGSGLDTLDAPLVERIVALVHNGQASSVAAAARAVVGDGIGVPGGGEVDSKVDRLRRKARDMLKPGE